MNDATMRTGAINLTGGREAGVSFDLFRQLFRDRQFVWVTVIYGVAVSLLTLALPISVQVLIGAVANTAVVRSVVILAVILFVLLAISGLLVAMQTYVLDLFQRRFYGRLTSEIAMRTIYAETSHFERINREQLINHYFEIDMIQKSLPSMLSNGLALLLQTLVGYVVVSFYHPIFLFFCLAHALAVYLIWRHADAGAVRTVIQLSKAKHEMANWLESLARNHRLFKSRRGIDYAVGRTDDLTEHYIERRKRHFAYFFSQHIGFLGLYAVGSAIVLGVAGWLVIVGQLSLGQLVAAELILGAIFVGLSRFSYYLDLYYGICASLDKLGRFFDLPLEDVSGDERLTDWRPELRLDAAGASFRGRQYRIDADFPAGSRTLVAAENSGIVLVFRDLISGLRNPESGRVTLDEHEVEDFNAHLLRNEVLIVSDANIFQTTIADFLRIADPELSRARMRELLTVVGLQSVVDELPDGLDTELNDAGLPLSTSEVIRLKIAQAIAGRPRVLMLLPACDVLRAARRRAILDYLQTADTTVIMLTNRRDVQAFDRFMWLGNRRTEIFSSITDLVNWEARNFGPRDETGPSGAAS